jgi:FMN phosphatase YigB (HAD superfamily)
MAGGRVLRSAVATGRSTLRRHDLLERICIAKPHVRIFEHAAEQLGGIAPREALHVGDPES